MFVFNIPKKLTNWCFRGRLKIFLSNLIPLLRPPLLLATTNFKFLISNLNAFHFNLVKLVYFKILTRKKCSRAANQPAMKARYGLNKNGAVPGWRCYAQFTDISLTDSCIDQFGQRL